MSIEYQNVEIEISRCVAGEWEVRLLESPIDRPRERFEFEGQLPILRKKVKRLNEILFEGESEAERHTQAIEIGVDLYRMLLPGKIRNTFEKSLVLLDEYRNQTDKGFRLRLSFGGNDGFHPDLVNLPWELLCNPETERFIADQPQTPIVRYLDLSRQEKPIKAKPPLKVLAVLASPKDSRLKPVDTESHRKILKQAQKESKWLELHFVKPTLDALYEKLDRHRQEGEPFHVLHFLGHGLFHEGHGVLCFEKSDGSLDLVRGVDLARQLESMSEIRLVVLATCKGAQMMTENGQNPFNGVASALVASRVPAVVGMQFSISEGAAADFTSTFYTTLGSSRCVDVDEAMAEGRRRILRKDAGSLEWATPVLFLRSPNGHLLDLEGAEAKPKKIAIFNIQDHGPDDMEVAYPVDLCDYFEVKKQRAYIRDPDDWNGGVLESLVRTFTSENLPTDIPYSLFLAAPISVAYAAGHLLEVKSGHKVLEVSQRGFHGTKPWTFEGTPSSQAASWLPQVESQKAISDHFPFSTAASEVAVAVSLSQPVVPAIGHYLSCDPTAPKIGHLINAMLGDSTSQMSIECGAHAFALANELVDRIHAFISERGRPKVHLFMAVPNSFAYIMGRLSKHIPEVQLYEYDFTGGESGTYKPSILLR